MKTLLSQNIGVPTPVGFSNPPAVEEAIIAISPLILVPSLIALFLTLGVRKFIKNPFYNRLLLGLVWLTLAGWCAYWIYIIGKIYLF